MQIIAKTRACGSPSDLQPHPPSPLAAGSPVLVESSALDDDDEPSDADEPSDDDVLVSFVMGSQVSTGSIRAPSQK